MTYNQYVLPSIETAQMGDETLNSSQDLEQF